MRVQHATPPTVDRRAHREAKSGQMSGQCFVAAMLAPALELDLAVRRPTHAECIAVRSAAGMAANDDYLAGDQQMKLAALMKVGFACIDATLPTYTLYRPATVPEEGCYFALIRVGLMGGRHSEPLATLGDTQCRLLLRGEACALLQQRGFHEVALERSEAGPNLDGSGVANGADWAAASARRRRRVRFEEMPAPMA